MIAAPCAAIMTACASGRIWQTSATTCNRYTEKGNIRPGCLYFEQTRHTVCASFANAWKSNGLEFDGQSGKSFEESLALFGLPLTNEIAVSLADGKRHIVQYFERARFESHPDNPAPYNILFGLLDNEARAGTLLARPQALLPAPLFFLYETQIVRLERDGLTPMAWQYHIRLGRDRRLGIGRQWFPATRHLW